MTRMMLAGSVALTVLAVPAPALAVTTDPAIPASLTFGTGIVGLALAVVLLLDVLALRKVASGAILVEDISYVMCAVLCLAASVLLGWVTRFADGLAADQARLGADLLIIASMALFGVYFWKIRRAFKRFLGTFPAEDVRAAVDASEAEDA